jgi:hypothetical protein
VIPPNNVTSLALMTAKVQCPAGKRVIAGGFNLRDPWARQLTLLTSFPDPATESWVVELVNKTTLNLGQVPVVMHATCVAK